MDGWFDRWCFTSVLPPFQSRFHLTQTNENPTHPANQRPTLVFTFFLESRPLILHESTGWSGRLLSRRQQRWREPRAMVQLDTDSPCFSGFWGRFLASWCICWLSRLQHAFFVLVPFFMFFFLQFVSLNWLISEQQELWFPTTLSKNKIMN